MVEDAAHIRNDGKLVATVGWCRRENIVSLGVAVPNSRGETASKKRGREIAIGRARNIFRGGLDRYQVWLNPHATIETQTQTLAIEIADTLCSLVRVAVHPHEFYRQIHWLAGTIARATNTEME